MRKHCAKWILCVFLTAITLSACGKKDEASVLVIAEEEATDTKEIAQTTVMTEIESEEETEEESAVSYKSDLSSSKSSQAGESSSINTRTETTRSAVSSHQHQYEADVDGHWLICGCDTAQTKEVHDPDVNGICFICGVDVNELEAKRDALLAQGTPNNGATSDSSDDTEDESDEPVETPSEPSPEPSEPEFPKVDEDYAEKNKEYLESIIQWRRLKRNWISNISLGDLYYSSKDLSDEQILEEARALLRQEKCIEVYTWVRPADGKLGPDDQVIIQLKQDTMFHSGSKFVERMDEYLRNMNVELPYQHILENRYLQNMEQELESHVNSLTGEEYAQMQLAIYEFLLTYALKCDMRQDNISTELQESPYVRQACYVSYDELEVFLESNKALSGIKRYYGLMLTEDGKREFMFLLSNFLEDNAPDMCFWLSQISVKDAQRLLIEFSMFGIYETVQEPDGSITLDKTQYKSIATVAKEVDDRLNQIVEDVVEPNMSVFAKEYALFHYCDTFFEYDGGDDLGGTYAIGDNPYTIASPIDPATGKKDPDVALHSTQHEMSIYTPAMTGWGVCVGHARVFEALCTKIGIPCSYEDGASHAWNSVTINGKSYLVDAGKRSPYPHFNITHEWNDTYQVIDPKIYNVICSKDKYANSSSPIPLYQAGYVEATTQQDGEWVYSINFDDNGSLYKIKADGSGNKKVCDSETTIEAAYDWLTRPKDEPEGQTDQAKDESEDKEEQAPSVPDLWAGQWANAQYGTEYSGQGYTNPGAIDYRWALGHNFQLFKENGEIIYKVNNISRVTEIPMLKNRDEIINLTCNMNDAYYNLGILSGTATINTSRSLGDSINSVVFYVDGIEYPASQMTESEDGQSVDFTFRLPTDKGMEHHDLEILATTINGGVKRQKVMTQTLHPTGIKESYLWNGKYYTINGITGKEGQLFIFVERYLQDGTKDASNVLQFPDYTGKEAMNVPFFAYKEAEDIFRIELSGGTEYWIQLTTDENVAVVSKAPEEESEDGRVLIYSAEDFCELADSIAKGENQDVTVEVLAELDFSKLPEGVSFKPIGTESYPFKGTWNGNHFKMHGLNIRKKGVGAVFAYANGALFQNINICDSSIVGKDEAGVFGLITDSSICNVRVSNVVVEGSVAGMVADSDKGTIANVYIPGVTVKGTGYAGGVCANASNTTIKEAVVYGEITGKGPTGGIVGYLEKGRIEYGYSQADVISTGTGGLSCTGGIVGLASQAESISKCYYEGNVTAAGDYAGGIAGQCSTVTDGLYHVENYGTVTGKKNVGGIVGLIGNTAKLDTVVNGGVVTGTENVGGIFGRSNGTLKLCKCGSFGISDGDTNVGRIAGYVGKGCDIYDTIYTPDKCRATEADCKELFGICEEEAEILIDTTELPYEVGQWGYDLPE